MSLSALICGLKRRKEAVVESYAGAVARMADEGDVPLDLLEGLLAAAGKTPEDFQSDVERLRRRREAALRLGDVSGCAERRKAASKRLAAARATLDRAEAEFDEVAGDVEAELANVRTVELAVEESRRFLEETASPAVAEQVRDAERRAGQAAKELTAAMSELDRLRHQLEAAEQRQADASAGRVSLIGTRAYIGPETSESACERRVEQNRAAVDNAQERLAAARSAHEGAQSEVVAVRRRLLVP